MADHRGFKQLVRARMARTGESYTTARRHVVAAARASAPPLPAGLVAGYDTFGTEQHHGSALLAHLLRQAGVIAPHTGEPYGEAMLAGLAGGIGFMVAVFEYRGIPPILTIVAQHHPDPWLPAALGRLGIGYDEAHSSSTAKAMAALRASLDDGRPVYAIVDRTGLPWHEGVHAIATDPYGVVVAGHDGDVVLLDDVGVAPHPMPVDDFAAAWAGYRKGRHHRLVVPAGAVAGTPLDEAVRAAIGTTVAHLTGPVLGNSFDVNFGFSGMARLAEQLRDRRTKSGWAKRFADPTALAAVLGRIDECLEVEWTAPGATRPLYAMFLEEAAGILGAAASIKLTGAAALFRESGERWSAVAARAGAGAGADPVALFDELADLVDAARGLEERAVALLRLVV